MLMANWFDDLSRRMADEKLPRRAIMRKIAGSVVGMTLAFLLPGQALAKANALSRHCTTPCNGCTQSCDFDNCNGNFNCYCFFRNGTAALGGCGCNILCSQGQPCTSSSQCPGGSFCATQTACTCNATSGICVPFCTGKNKNCQPPGGHGLTASGRLL